MEGGWAEEGDPAWDRTLGNMQSHGSQPPLEEREGQLKVATPLSFSIHHLPLPKLSIIHLLEKGKSMFTNIN